MNLLVDGKVAAMWGFGGEMISDEAEMWLMTANAALAGVLSHSRKGSPSC